MVKDAARFGVEKRSGETKQTMRRVCQDEPFTNLYSRVARERGDGNRMRMRLAGGYVILRDGRKKL